MLTLSLLQARPTPTHVLCLGAHSDDIEIGCGGTMLSLLQASSALTVTWVVFGAQGTRVEEARHRAASFLAEAAKREIVIHGFRDGFFPYTGAQIKETFEALKARISPEPLEEVFCRRKIDILVASFASQRDKHWPSTYAEAFYGRKLVVG